MKKTIFALMLLSFVAFSCGNEEANKEEQALIEEANQLDSISNEMENATNEIEAAEEEVDNLLKELEEE